MFKETWERAAKWIGKRKIPAYKVGRQWKLKLSEIDEWVPSGGAADYDQATVQTGKGLNA